MLLIFEGLVLLSRLYHLGTTFVIVAEVIYLIRIGIRQLLSEIGYSLKFRIRYCFHCSKAEIYLRNVDGTGEEGRLNMYLF